MKILPTLCLLLPMTVFAQMKLTITYGSVPGQQNLDLYPNPDPHEDDTCYLFIHGGGFYSGDKGDWQYIPAAVQSKGYHAASMNYRYVSSTVHWGEINDDVAVAMDSIQNRTGCENFILVGASAGGCIVFNYGRSGDLRVKLLVSCSGVYDLTCCFTSKLNQPFALYSNGNDSAASPYHNIGTYPRSIITHGLLDKVIHPIQAKRMAKALKQNGNDCTLYIDPTWEHVMGINEASGVMMLIVRYIRLITD